MLSYKFNDCVDAWSSLIKKFINGDPELFAEGQGAVITGSSFSYGLSLLIENAHFDPKFDFGKTMAYTISKWSTLLNNYVDLDALDQVKLLIRELEKNKAVNRNYHIAFSFADAHNNGKGCLVSGTFSRMIYQDKPRLTVYMRASEIVTRLPWDLLLAVRLGEYVYGHSDFSIEVLLRAAWADDINLMIYNNYEPVEPIIEAVEDPTRQKRMKKVLRRMKKAADNGTDPKFQAYMRVYKLYNPEAYGKEAPKSLFAEDCAIGNWDNIPLPESCPSITVRNQIKKVYMKLCEKYGLDLTKSADKSKKSFKFKPADFSGDNTEIEIEEDTPEEAVMETEE